MKGKTGPCGKCRKPFTINDQCIIANVEADVPRPDEPASGDQAANRPSVKPGQHAGQLNTPTPKPPIETPQVPPIPAGSPIVYIEPVGCHFALPTAGWTRESVEEEQRLNSLITATNPAVGTIQCFLADWKLTFDDLFEGIAEYCRDRLSRFALLARKRVTLAGMPAIMLEYKGAVRGDPKEVYFFLSYFLLKDGKFLEISGSTRVDDARVVRDELAYLTETLSFSPLSEQQRQCALAVSDVGDGDSTPQRVRGRGPSEEQISAMVMPILLGMVAGTVVGIPVAVVGAWVLGGIFIGISDFWTLALFLHWACVSYIGPLYAGWLINPKVIKVRDPKLSGGMQKAIGRIIGFFIVLWLRGTQAMFSRIARFIGGVFRTGLRFNLQGICIFAAACALYGLSLGLLIYRANFSADAVSDQQSPAYSSAYNEGVQLLDKKDFDRAVVALDKAIALDPKAAHAYNNRGHAHRFKQKPDWAMAIGDFDRAIELDPNFPAPYMNRGAIYHLQGKWDAAIADFSRAIPLAYPCPSWVFHLRGLCHIRKQNHDAAIADFDQALLTDGRNPNHYVQRGVCYHEKREHNKALADFDSALRLDAKNAEAYFYRAGCYQDQKDYDKAIADYTKAFELNSQYENAILLRGDAWRDKGDKQKALADYRKFTEIAPKRTDTVDRIKQLQ